MVLVVDTPRSDTSRLSRMSRIITRVLLLYLP